MHSVENCLALGEKVDKVMVGLRPFKTKRGDRILIILQFSSVA